MKNTTLFRKFLSSNYSMGVLLTGSSLTLGLLREFLILYLLGLTSVNDQLQLYLSIFYISGLSIDGIRLGCLNLFTRIQLSGMMLALSIVVIPFILGFILLLYLFFKEGEKLLLVITFFGCYLNLIIVLWITHLQRQGFFVLSQCLNLLPNLIFIPGILICYIIHSSHLLENLVMMSALIPIFQGMILFFIPISSSITKNQDRMTVQNAVFIFGKQFLSVIGEQGFQFILRAVLLRQAQGMLSLFAITTRMIAALRFILIDTYINSKLGSWTHQKEKQDELFIKFPSQILIILLILMGLMIFVPLNSPGQMMGVLLLFLGIGFCLINIVRMIYFRINHLTHDSSFIIKFSWIDISVAITAMIFSQFLYSILLLLWLGYIVRPVIQWTLVKKRFHGLENSLHALS